MYVVEGEFMNVNGDCFCVDSTLRKKLWFSRTQQIFLPFFSSFLNGLFSFLFNVHYMLCHAIFRIQQYLTFLKQLLLLVESKKYTAQ